MLCAFPKAMAQANVAADRLTKIAGHHELHWRGRVRRTNGGTGVRQGSGIFVGPFRKAQSARPTFVSPESARNGSITWEAEHGRRRRSRPWSALPSATDVPASACGVRKVPPIADITRCARAYRPSPTGLAVVQMGTRSGNTGTPMSRRPSRQRAAL
jgi:hypothetical protein